MIEIYDEIDIDDGPIFPDLTNRLLESFDGAGVLYGDPGLLVVTRDGIVYTGPDDRQLALHNAFLQGVTGTDQQDPIMALLALLTSAGDDPLSLLPAGDDQS